MVLRENELVAQDLEIFREGVSCIPSYRSIPELALAGVFHGLVLDSLMLSSIGSVGCR